MSNSGTVSSVHHRGVEADAHRKTPLRFSDFCRTARRSNKGKRHENRSLHDVRELDDAGTIKGLARSHSGESADSEDCPKFPQLEHRAGLGSHASGMTRDEDAGQLRLITSGIVLKLKN